MEKDALRQLPSIDQLLNHERGIELIDLYGHNASVQALRDSIREARNAILEGSVQSITSSEILSTAFKHLYQLTSPSLVPVINATGVVLHTNLGRSPISIGARNALAGSAYGYSNLEYDLESGKRGKRSELVQDMLSCISGAEAGFAVNNNAAGVLLAMAALSYQRQVIISRGQLVEIGGSFRVPDVMAQSGAELVEVGTTNRTYTRDYEAAITDKTAAILVAHHSNFQIVGFTTEPTIADLAQLAHSRGLVLIHDIGSGALIDTAQFGLAHEMMVQESLAAGADIVLFSGDKLVGGPQAGLIVGKRDLVSQISRHPLARSVRADKLCLAAIHSTLVSYLTHRETKEIPIWIMISATLDQLKPRAEHWVTSWQDAGIEANILEGLSTVGGGSLPGETLPTWLASIRHPRPQQVAAALRRLDPPIITRIADDKVVLDPRTVLEEQDQTIIDSVPLAITSMNAKEREQE